MKTDSITENNILLAGLVVILGLIAGFLYWYSPIALLVLPFGLITLAVLWVMYYRPTWVVFFLVAYMPFEEIVLKYAPIPDRVFSYSRFFGEALIFITFLFLLLRKLIRGEKLRRTPIDGYLIVFLAIVLVTMLVNRPPFIGSLVNLRALLRYSVLFYLVVNLNLKEEQVKKILNIILLIGVIQLLIGALQLLWGSRINSILLPRVANIELGGYSRGFILLTRGREVGSIFGTLGDTLFLALFWTIVFGVYLGQIVKIGFRQIIFILLLFIGINFTYTRAVVYGIFIMLFVFYRMRFGRGRTAALVFVSSLLGLSGLILLLNSNFIRREYVNPLKEEQGFIQNLTGIFTVDYFERAQNQRLGTLTGVPPIVLLTKPFLGYGPDENTTIESLNANLPRFNLPLMKKESFTKTGFEDVFWVALLAYYGLLGLATILMLFIKLYVSFLDIYKRTHLQLIRNLAATAAIIVVLVGYLLFFYRVLEFRSFSFYFWLIPGMLFNLHSAEIRSINRKSDDFTFEKNGELTS